MDILRVLQQLGINSLHFCKETKVPSMNINCVAQLMADESIKMIVNSMS